MYERNVDEDQDDDDDDDDDNEDEDDNGDDGKTAEPTEFFDVSNRRRKRE